MVPSNSHSFWLLFAQKVGTNTGKRKSDCAEVDLVSQRSFDAGQTLGINARFLQANWRRQPTGGDDFRTTFVNQFTKFVPINNCKHFSVASNFSKYEELAA
ncbi:hypothetical protein POM88_046287 [Heracleum sosnowskyi]|uniref:Uncharacterized protein n=1 Tax=Heracleum sosnowskyi TaxID=360622 RepID=A0AAD8H8Y7_9APIA|nr:hypothetical protein POM88_046287 [Heracleum sosnowskyi]